MNHNLILMGFMGCGKTSTGKILSEKLGLSFVDTDDVIEERAGKPITRIFELFGEQVFRDMETGLLLELEQDEHRHVISIGGGMPVREENRRLLKKLGTVVYLTASDEELFKRLRGDQTRPLLAGSDLAGRIHAMKAAREAIYTDLASAVVSTDGVSPGQVAEKIVCLWDPDEKKVENDQWIG